MISNFRYALKTLVFTSILLQSCIERKFPEKIERVLQIAGSNRNSLEEVLDHYSGSPADSLKLKAAYFLIENIEGWYYYDGDLLKKYQEYLKLIRHDDKHGEYFMKSFMAMYGSFSYDGVERKYDIDEITAAQMIENIDVSFKVWREQPWGKDITFNQFCEYILPFRIANELPAHNRREIYDAFNSLLDSVRLVQGDAISAGIVVNEGLKNPRWLLSLRSAFLPHYPASSIIKYKAGSCREMTDLAFYTMRAVGIPVAIDFVPQWPYRSMGHEFNSLLDKEGKMITFMGAEDNPGTPHKPLTKKGKVYRHMYSINSSSLGVLREEGEIVPSLLRDPRLRDVTEEYVSCFDVDIKLQNLKEKVSNPRHAYVAVFDNKSWVPIDWGNVKDDVVTFKKLEGDIVYIAGYYDNSLIPSSNPFLLTKEGKVEFLNIDSVSSNSTMTIDRIFPLTADSYDLWNLGGGYFEGANKPDFSDAEKLYKMPVKPNPFWNEIPIDNAKKFRYVRFLRGGNITLGELEFYSGGRKLNGRVFGTKPGWYSDKTFDKAFDNNVFTSFDASGVESDTSLLGMDLGSANRIEKIRVSPPVSDEIASKIIEGHHYQLLVWKDRRWVTAGKANGRDSKVTFKSVPSNGLYLLKDIDDNAVEGRIFTYHGKPEWY